MTVKHVVVAVIGIVGLGALGGLTAHEAILDRKVQNLQQENAIKAQPTAVIPTASPSATVAPTKPATRTYQYVAPTKALVK